MELPALLTLAPVIPVLTVENPETAPRLAEALVDGGLPVLEVTLRTEAALTAIERMSTVPGAIVGAGTVTSAEQLNAVRAAGARFAVSPGFDDALVEAAADFPLLAGIATASEAMAARRHRLKQVKFFPATAMGGIATLRAFSGPFPDLQFCPTGGIGVENAGEFLALPNVLCVGGSWVAPKSAIAAEDWSSIRDLASATAKL